MRSISTQKNRNCLKNNSGQTLVVIVFLLLFSTMVGITISTRFVNTLRGFVRTDDSVKALKAAEAIIERMLITPNSVLEGYIAAGNCDGNCLYSVTEPNGNIVSADVTLKYSGDTDGPYTIYIQPGEAGQVNMTGYGTGKVVDICWHGSASVYTAYAYEESGETKIASYAVNSVASPYNDNGFDTAAANYGYPNCFPVSTTGTPKYIRLRTYYESAYVTSLPTPGETIPRQGIILDAHGYSGDSVKNVVVLKTDAIAPSFFDYAILQTSTTSPLTNSYSP